jgi:hypothetical protein
MRGADADVPLSEQVNVIASLKFSVVVITIISLFLH